MTLPVICIDGPSGSGKGTLCQMLALKLGWHLLDSGALYRLVGMAADKHQSDFSDEQAVAALAAASSAASSRAIADTSTSAGRRSRSSTPSAATRAARKT